MTSHDTTAAALGGGIARRRQAAHVADPPASSPPTSFSLLWQHKFALAAGALAGILLGLLISLLQPTAYTSESRIFFSSQSTFDPLGTNSFTSDPTRYLEQQAALLTSEPVLTQAVEADETIGDMTEVRDSLTVTASGEADIVTIKAAADTGDRAEDRVVAVVDAYRAFQQAAITDRTNALTDLSSSGERRQIEQRAALYGDGVALVEPPAAEEVSSLIRNTTVGGLVGLLLALAWALGRRRPTPPAAATPSPAGDPGQPGHDSSVDDDWEWELARRE